VYLSSNVWHYIILASVVVVVVVVVLIQRLRPLGHAREASLSRLPRPERGSSRLITIGLNSSLPRPPPLRTGRKRPSIPEFGPVA